MSLRDVNIGIEYRTLVENIARDFYIPLLSEAVSYKRAVGFFCSSSLIKITKGIEGLIKNGGSIQLIVSPHLSDEDFEAIKQGYRLRDDIIREALYKELDAPRNSFQERQLNLLANLIADKIMDVKVVITQSRGQYGMFHEKVGIIEDALGNKVAFSGSMNETANAFEANYETVDVFKSWTGDSERVARKERAFDRIWDNTEDNVETIDFPELKEELISRYKKEKVDYKQVVNSKSIEICDEEYDFFRLPATLDLYDYQKMAIEKWFNRKCCGVYDMATGAGKTYTALASITKLSQSLDENLAVVIVVPYQHLVEQWVDDLVQFNVNPIIAYSYSGNRWREEFNNAVRAYNTSAINHFCIITTTASFCLDDFQSILSKFKKNFCFVADEAHNLGAANISRLLPKKARYRLALSATIERHGDEAGTKALYDYFGGEPCIKFTLDEAIRKGFLTKYNYYPVIVYLDGDEREEYCNLSSKIRKMVMCNKDMEDSALKTLLLKRARLVAGCKAKVDKLIEIIEPYKNQNNILIYCGATKYDSDTLDGEEIRQIEEVNKRLNFVYGMKVHKFTSSENQKERTIIKQMFQDQEIQAITAIKCLDEGVNIPAIKTAFILASSTNPKEYIQRRGRVLRKFKGKEYAEIYDFITLPRPLEDVRLCDYEELQFDYSLVKREFERLLDFARTAKNPYEIDEIKSSIEEIYDVNELGGEDFYE